jgi:hypothetical protein
MWKSLCQVTDDGEDENEPRTSCYTLICGRMGILQFITQNFLPTFLRKESEAYEITSLLSVRLSVSPL